MVSVLDPEAVVKVGHRRPLFREPLHLGAGDPAWISATQRSVETKRLVRAARAQSECGSLMKRRSRGARLVGCDVRRERFVDVAQRRFELGFHHE